MSYSWPKKTMMDTRPRLIWRSHRGTDSRNLSTADLGRLIGYSYALVVCRYRIGLTEETETQRQTERQRQTDRQIESETDRQSYR